MSGAPDGDFFVALGCFVIPVDPAVPYRALTLTKVLGGVNRESVGLARKLPKSAICGGATAEKQKKKAAHEGAAESTGRRKHGMQPPLHAATNHHPRQLMMR